MTGAPQPDVTLLLERARAVYELARGDQIAQVYAGMRRVAVGLMRVRHWRIARARLSNALGGEGVG